MGGNWQFLLLSTRTDHTDSEVVSAAVNFPPCSIFNTGCFLSFSDSYMFLAITLYTNKWFL